MSATSSGGNDSRIRISGGGGSMSEGSDTGESSQSTMSITDSPSTSFQPNQESNITKINVLENSDSGAVHVDMTGSNVNLTLSERQTAEGVVNMGFDNDEGANRGDVEFKSINGSIKTDKVSEAVNLELVNMVPYSNGNGTSYGVPVNGIPVKKDSEGADMSSPYDEYFVPVNEHKKYMRGEKLYVTKDKRRPASWRKCLSWIIACAVISVVLLVAILAGTGVILSQDTNMVKEASVGRNFAGANTNSLVTNGSLSDFQNKSPTEEWLSYENNMTHKYVPRSIELGLNIDNLKWSSAYLNSNSTEYQQLLAATENQLKMILFNKNFLNPDEMNLGLNMVNISDQFKALYRLGWNFKHDGNNEADPITVDDVKKRIFESLTRNNGYIDKYHIDMDKIHVGYVVNICEVNNGGCSHICYYNYMNQQFTCTCPTHLVLDNTLKTCVEWSGSLEQDYESIPIQKEFGVVHSNANDNGGGVPYSHDHEFASEHGSDHEYKSNRNEGSHFDNRLIHEHRSNQNEDSNSEHDLIHAHGSDHEHGSTDVYGSTDTHGSNHEQGFNQNEESHFEHGLIHQHGSDREHESTDVYGSTDTHGSTDVHGSTFAHGSDHEQGFNQNEESHFEHGSINEHGSADVHGSSHEHGSNREHVLNYDELEHNSQSPFSKQANAGFIPHSEARNNKDHGTIDVLSSEPSSKPDSKLDGETSSTPDSETTVNSASVSSSEPNSEHDIEPAPEPTPEPSSDLKPNIVSHHDKAHQSGEAAESSASSSEDNIDQAHKTHTHFGSEPASRTEASLSKKGQNDSNIEFISRTPVNQEHEYEPRTTTEFEDHDSSKLVPKSTFQASHDSTSEPTPSEHSSQFHSPEYNLVSSTPAVDQEFSDETHSSKFDENSASPSVIYIDGEKNSASMIGKTESTPAQTTAGQSVSNTHNVMNHHEVPLLEQILLEDSSLNLTENNVNLKSKSPGQTLWDNVEDDAKKESVTEGIVTDKSSPITEKPSFELGVKPEKEQEMEYKSLNEKDMFNETVYSNDEKTTPTYSITGTEEGPMSTDFSNLKDLDAKEEGKFPTHKSTKKMLSDPIKEMVTVYPGPESIVVVEDSTHPIKEKFDEHEFSKYSGVEPGVKPNSTEGFNTVQGNIYETTVTPEKVSAAPVNVHTDFSVEEPEPKIKTRIEKNPTKVSSGQQNSHSETSETGMGQVEFTTVMADEIQEIKQNKSNEDAILQSTTMESTVSENQHSVLKSENTLINGSDHQASNSELGLAKPDIKLENHTFVYEIMEKKLNDNKEDTTSPSIAHAVTMSELETTKKVEDGELRPENSETDNQESYNLKTKTSGDSGSDSAFDKAMTTTVESVGNEQMATISPSDHNTNANERETVNGDEGKIEKATEPNSGTKDDHHIPQVHVDSSHSDNISNNVKDEGVDTDEYNTLLDNEKYKNQYSSDGKNIFNEYSSKPTFLKGDKKKVKDFEKHDKLESDKKAEEVTKPFIVDKDYVLKKHESGSGFVDSNYRLNTEQTTIGLKEFTENHKLTSEGIPVLPYNVYNAENPDFGLLHTVPPSFEVNTYLPDGEVEISSVKTQSAEDGFNSKEEEFKSEKDFPKQDKDYKYDKQKGGKKKDLKKKGSKDGKNVEVDEKRYYSEVAGEKNDAFSSDKDREGLNYFTIAPHDKTAVNGMHNHDEEKGNESPNETVTEYYNVRKTQKFPNSDVKPVYETPIEDIENPIKYGVTEGFPGKSDMIGGNQKSILGVTDSSNNASEKATITETPKLLDDGKSEASNNEKIKENSYEVSKTETKVAGISSEGVAEIYREGTTDSHHTKSNGSESHDIHSVGFATEKAMNSEVNLSMDKSQTLQKPTSENSPSSTLSTTHQDDAHKGSVTYSEVNFNEGTPSTEHEGVSIIKNSESENSGTQTAIDGTTVVSAAGKEISVVNEKEPGSKVKVLSSGGKPVTRITSYETRGFDDNGDSTVYSITNSSARNPTFVFTGSDGTRYNSSINTFEDVNLPLKRIYNFTPNRNGGSFTSNNYTFPSGNITALNFPPFFRSKPLYNGQEFRYNTTHSFVPPPLDFNGTVSNTTILRIKNGLPFDTVIDGRFNPQEGSYQTFTNSSGTYIYSKTQPSFKIKGESGDFGKSSVYILGNNSGTNAFVANSSNPLKSHHVIFRNSTVFAVQNLSDSNSPTTFEVLRTTLPTEGNTSRKSSESTFSSLGTGKTGDYLGYISRCAAGQFQCVNGTSKRGSSCIKLSSKCDSINDCSDGSDEAGCIENGCPGNFQCSDGTCLKRHLVCNGIVDCADSSDEKECEHWKCEFDEFKCPSGRCIPVVWQCDGKADCDNHTDEQNCQRSCGNDEYLCPEGWCVPQTYRCNGIKECSNGEDEQLCDCSIDEFKCQSGGCVRKDQVCNGIDDCPDRTDEWDCMQLPKNSTFLQIRTSSGELEPVCADDWSTALSDEVCGFFGYSSSVPVVESETTPFANVKSFYKLKNETSLGNINFLVNLMKTNKTCASKKWVEISCQEFSCGSRSMEDGSSAEGKFAGSMDSTAGQWPSVSLLYNVRNMHSCTANVLTPRWVLASYNCLKMSNKNFNQKDWKLYGGSNVFEPEKESGETRKISAIIPHPQVKFNQFLFSNDLALVKLDEPLSFSNNVGAVCLPEQNIHPRQICVTAGWGLNGPEYKSIQQHLQYLPVPTMNLTECNSTEHYAGFITEDKICAGYNTAEKSLCYNEEGAPLMCVNDRGEWELQGILSYHSNCGRGSHPSIFSSIIPVKDWIKRTIGNSFEKYTSAGEKSIT